MTFLQSLNSKTCLIVAALEASILTGVLCMTGGQASLKLMSIIYEGYGNELSIWTLLWSRYQIAGYEGVWWVGLFSIMVTVSALPLCFCVLMMVLERRGRKPLLPVIIFYVLTAVLVFSFLSLFLGYLLLVALCVLMMGLGSCRNKSLSEDVSAGKGLSRFFKVGLLIKIICLFVWFLFLLFLCFNVIVPETIFSFLRLLLCHFLLLCLCVFMMELGSRGNKRLSDDVSACKGLRRFLCVGLWIKIICLFVWFNLLSFLGMCLGDILFPI